ncbi:MAG TPA: hypothetical protein DF383_10315 [Deltaproteobacteria bacterium]|nr:hypothetical protein [Deltaproteobacteria bacterium]
MEAAIELYPERELETKALSVPDQARAIQITDTNTYTKAGELLLAIKDLRKEIDATFDPIVKKAHEAHKEAVAQKKKVEAPLAEAEGIIKPRIAAYQAEQERIRREEEARLREEARKREEEERLALALEAEKEGMPEVAEEILEVPAFVPPPVVPSSTPKVSGISTRTVWKHRIINADLLPRQYLMPDEKALAAHGRALGSRAKVPGVEFYPEQVVAAGRR